MNQKNQVIDLTTDSIPKLLRQLFIPASVGMFFSVLYNVVDTYLGGQISPQALASLSIIFPIFFLIIAVSIGTLLCGSLRPSYLPSAPKKMSIGLLTNRPKSQKKG